MLTASVHDICLARCRRRDARLLLNIATITRCRHAPRDE